MLDLKRNVIPQKVETVHLIAACGTGMGAMACALKELGLQVTGSDHKVYPPMSTFLAEKGIKLDQGFDGDHLAYGPDLVVVGNAVVRDNPEVRALRQSGFYYCSMPQAINRFLASGKKIVLVAGTHGKTTTTSILAWIFFCAGLDPSFIIGGILNNFKSNYRVGQGEYIIIEGDEYDTAFFNKVPKFVHYAPHAAVLTSIEFDHADIYPDMEAVMAAFGDFAATVPRRSKLFCFDSDSNIAAIVARRNDLSTPYGEQVESPWRIDAMGFKNGRVEFDVLKDGAIYHRFRSPLPGKHNALNTLAAVAVADNAGISADTIAESLQTFRGTKRRQEVRGSRRGVTVIDDFAHHPTAVRETVDALRAFYPDGRLIAVFEPRTNTSMRAVFQTVYPLAFDGADITCIRKPPLLQKIPEGQRFSSRQLVADLNTRGKKAHYFADTDGIVAYLAETAQSGDVILIMSNGGFDNIHQRVLNIL